MSTPKNSPESLQIEMVPIAGDTFTMGGVAERYADRSHDDRFYNFADDLTPIREVTVPDFEISKYPITVGQYRKAVECGVCKPPQKDWSDEPGENEDMPIQGIHTRDAEKFAEFVGCRLPSEVEWEYAIVGVHYRPYAWGWSRPDLSSLINAEIESKTDRAALLERYGNEQLIPSNCMKWGKEVTGPEESDCTPEGVCKYYMVSELCADDWSCVYNNGSRPETYVISYDEKPYLNPDAKEKVVRHTTIGRGFAFKKDGTAFGFRVARSCRMSPEERKAFAERRDSGEALDRIRLQAQKNRLKEMYSAYLRARDGERSLEDCEAFAREMGLEFVDLPSGRFYAGHVKMPYSDESREAYVLKEMPAFEISKYPVTVEQMRQAVRRGFCPHPKTDVSGTNYTEEPGEGDLHPVKCSLRVARAFAKAVGGRLPCESEWLYAARGVEGRLFPWGDDAPTAEHANFDRVELPGGAEETEVCAYPLGATPEGVFDLAGNVLEMTELDERADELLGAQRTHLHGGNHGSSASEIANEAFQILSGAAGFRVIRVSKNPKTDAREPRMPADLYDVLCQYWERKKQEREKKAEEQASKAQKP